MTDYISSAQAIFRKLSLQHQVYTLAMLAYRSTLWAREFYPQLVQDRSEVVERLRAFNELQHQLSQHMVHLLYLEDNRYPDDVFISILFEITEQTGCYLGLVAFFEELPSLLTYASCTHPQA